MSKNGTEVSYPGNTVVVGNESKEKKQKKLEKEKTKKISIEKFLSIMQALKNEKEIGKFKLD